MPSFEIETSIDIDCYCNVCGAGICHKCTERTSHSMNNNLVIEPCDCQINKIEELERIIEELEREIEELKN